MNTCPEMNAMVKDLLLMGEEHDQYAAQYIEELELQVKELTNKFHRTDNALAKLVKAIETNRSFGYHGLTISSELINAKKVLRGEELDC